MRVEIKIEPGNTDPHAVLVIPRLTDSIASAIDLLENADTRPDVLTAKRDGQTFVLDPAMAEVVRTEGGRVLLYDHAGAAYELDGPLHEAQSRLGARFVRISKSALINIHRVDHVAPSFNGTMDVVMKNGVVDYISRKYLRDFKARLGL